VGGKKWGQTKNKHRTIDDAFIHWKTQGPFLSEMTKIKGMVGYARRGKECGRIRNRGVFSNQASFVLILFVIIVFVFDKNNGRLRSSFGKCYLRRGGDLISFWEDRLL